MSRDREDLAVLDYPRDRKLLISELTKLVRERKDSIRKIEKLLRPYCTRKAMRSR